MSLFYKRLSSAYYIEQSLACGLVCSKVNLDVEQSIPYHKVCSMRFQAACVHLKLFVHRTNYDTKVKFVLRG